MYSTYSSVKKTKYYCSIQFERLVKELEAKLDLTRGAPVFGADRISFDGHWRKVADKWSANIPPQINVDEWKKSDEMKYSRKPVKIERHRRPSIPLLALTEIKKSIDPNGGKSLTNRNTVVPSTPIINTPSRPFLQNRTKRSFQDAIAK
ncbi:unnamed protein product [Ceratitis capitata]|uniref:(Mediterranean fruit fly) hypothetical protein n=1 Tax=Ceratitis capitata TaxID=7213 RepID=A0A811UT25_CERCA|nr:unnamed protein product [Ceratitis capitata]